MKRMEAVVGDDGTVGPIAVSGGVTLPSAGTVRLVGAVAKLKRGSYPLFDTETVTLGDGWTVVAGEGTLRRPVKAAIRDGRLCLNVLNLGTVYLVR